MKKMALGTLIAVMIVLGFVMTVHTDPEHAGNLDNVTIGGESTYPVDSYE